MKLSKEELKRLTDEDIQYYFCNDQEDEEQRSIARILFYTCGIIGESKMREILMQLVEGAKLGVAYNGEKLPSGSTLICGVTDGNLYITSSSK